MLLAPALDDTARSADRAGQRSRFQSRGKDFPEIDEAGREGLPEGIAVLDDVADLNLSDCLRAPSSKAPTINCVRSKFTFSWGKRFL